MNCNEKPYCPFAFSVLGAAWVLIALFVGESGLFHLLPAAAIPVSVWTLVGILLAAFWKSRAFRGLVGELSDRTLLALHLTRFIGVYFLYLGSRDDLPRSFAFAAGWGDIIIAATVIPLLVAPRAIPLLVWNIAGLTDILLVVFSVARHVMTDRYSMAPFFSLPLCILPILIVPLIIASHLVLFARFYSSRRRSRAVNELPMLSQTHSESTI